jgi:hypothetical protein
MRQKIDPETWLLAGVALVAAVVINVGIVGMVWYCFTLGRSYP